MAKRILAILLLLLTIPRVSFAAGMEATGLTGSAFVYQQALFDYLVDDYFSSSTTSRIILENNAEERDAAALLKLVSDSRRLTTASTAYLALNPQVNISKEIPGIAGLLASFYRNDEPENVLFAAKELSGSTVAAYYSGLSLIRLDRLKEAFIALSKVPRSDKYYSYAVFAQAQIQVLTNENEAARATLSKIPAGQPQSIDKDMADRVALLTGQTLLDDERYVEAAVEFMKIAPSSALYRHSLMGQVYAFVGMGSFDECLKVMKLSLSLSSWGLEPIESQLFAARCASGLGMKDKAQWHYDKAAEGIASLGDYLSLVASDAQLRKPYVAALIGKDASVLDAEGQYYLSLMEQSRKTRRIRQEYAALADLKTVFHERDAGLAASQIYVQNTVKGMEEALAGLDQDITKIKIILVAIKKAADAKEKTLGSAESVNAPFFEVIGAEISKKWEATSKRKLTDEERYVIKLILYEGSEVLECMSSSISCPIIHMIVPTKSTQAGSGMPKPLEMLSRDIASIRRGEKLEIERIYDRLRFSAMNKLAATRKNLAALAETRLKVAELSASIEEAQAASLLEMDVHVRERFVKIRYELGDYKSHITALTREDKPVPDRQKTASAR
ncbi:MAG: hypothetical protein HY886_03595 [Deltaproteobacteria bacterium]|nr:hypothetical protein [Deltaproteobacteria bacterium]